MKTSLSWDEAMNHEIDHCDIDHGFAALRERFVVLAEPPVFAEPGEGPLDDPSTRQDHESDLVAGAFDDVENPAAEFRRPLHERSGIAAIGPNQTQSRKRSPQFPQYQPGAVPILDIRPMDHDGQKQAQRVDHDMTLASRDFLACVVPMRPFFSGAAVLTDWRSRIPADGEASRPASTRTFSRRAS